MEDIRYPDSANPVYCAYAYARDRAIYADNQQHDAMVQAHLQHKMAVEETVNDIITCNPNLEEIVYLVPLVLYGTIYNASDVDPAKIAETVWILAGGAAKAYPRGSIAVVFDAVISLLDSRDNKYWVPMIENKHACESGRALNFYRAMYNRAVTDLLVQQRF